MPPSNTYLCLGLNEPYIMMIHQNHHHYHYLHHHHHYVTILFTIIIIISFPQMSPSLLPYIKI